MGVMHRCYLLRVLNANLVRLLLGPLHVRNRPCKGLTPIKPALAAIMGGYGEWGMCVVLCGVV